MSKEDKQENKNDIFSCPIGVDDPIPKDADGNPVGLTRCKRIEICKDLNILKGYAHDRKSKDNQYRVAAAKALSTIYTKEAGELLRYLAADPDWKVKKNARKYLEKRNNKIKQTKISNGTWIE